MAERAATLTPSPKPTLTPTPTLAGWIRLLTITETVEPTIEWRAWTPEVKPDDNLLVEKVTEYVEQRTTCVFPCWLGIVNGVTRYDPALTVLKQVFGSPFSRAIFPNNVKKIAIGLRGKTSASYTTFIFSNDVNTQTDIDFLESRSFKLSRVLNDYGKPDRILIGGWLLTDNGVPYVITILVYEREGMLFEYHGDGMLLDHTARFCPQNQNASFIILWDQKSGVTVEEALRDPSGVSFGSPLDRPLERVTDETIDSFTEKMTDPSGPGCLEVSRSKWGKEK